MRWKISNSLEDYDSTINFMESEIIKIKNDQLDDLTWLLEYPSLYTAGLTANSTDLLDKDKFPVYQSKRGGKYTYHGPGQSIVYPLINLNKREKDINKYISNLELAIIGILKDIGIKGETNKNHHGIFVKKKNSQNYKIASIGCRFKNWVSYHGFSINRNPNLEHYSGINPCGLDNKNVTSIEDLGKNVTKNELDIAIKENLIKILNI